MSVVRAFARLAVPLAMALLSGLAVASGPDLSALVGRWQLDPALTHMGRFGPTGQNMTRAPTFTFVFAPNGATLDVNVYAEYPQSRPTRTMALIPDGQPHPCLDEAACLTAGGDARDQTYVYRVVNPRLIVRLFYIKGKLSEYSTYAVSADRQTFTLIAWSPDTPFYQNIQVFHRQP